MLDTTALSAEDVHEIDYRDQYVSEQEERAWEESYSCRLEIPQHLSALQLGRDSVLLEIGCGRGRFTRLLAPKCSAIVGVDFSLQSLRFLADRLDLNTNVLLVHADATKVRVAPRAFTRAFSTTPLDLREQRMAVHRLVSDALADNGRWVFGVERYNLRHKLRNQPRVLRYEDDGSGSIYFRMLRHEVEREAHPYFEKVNCHAIQVRLPFVKSVLLGRIAEHLPILRDLGHLWLLTAERPIRELTLEG
jgi:SAM-dependent methyltransferase